MKISMGLVKGLALMALSAGLIADEGQSPNPTTFPESLAPNERRIVIIGTNDIHGSIEPSLTRDGSLGYGGLNFLGGATRAIKQGLTKKFGQSAGVLLLDAGDQFQGTLLSNYTEGRVTFEAMNQAGYDAVVPGNHDYDFGPLGWLQDAPDALHPNPFEVIGTLQKIAKFPLLSASTFFKNSFFDLQGNPLSVTQSGCKPIGQTSAQVIDYSKVQRPSFLTPYLIKEVAGVRVAIIGIDNQGTGLITTIENVSELCFEDEAESYLRTRAELEGKADLFVMVIHQGNAGLENTLTKIVSKISEIGPDTLHAVVAGHTHQINQLAIAGIPIIQSGANGQLFGRIDLIYDMDQKSVLAAKNWYAAGVKLDPLRCEPKIGAFCKQIDPLNKQSFNVTYEDIPVSPVPEIEDAIKKGVLQLKPIAERELGIVKQRLQRDRILESSLSNAMTDLFREYSGAEVAMINTGGLRSDLFAGKLIYKDFFEVLPFGNRGVVLNPMPVSNLLELLLRSVKTCGNYGALMQSGLKVEFIRDCSKATDGVDVNAKLSKVTLLNGEVLYDGSSGDAAQSASQKMVTVATLDFLAQGGSGYESFKGVGIAKDLGILRESLTDYLIQNPKVFEGGVDGRWLQKLSAH